MSLKAILLSALLLATLKAQPSQHSVTLTWTDTLNPTGTTYTVYRASGSCTSTPLTFAAVASGLATMTDVDAAMTPGKYCYQVTANLNGMESDPSPTADAAVK